MKIGIFDSGLGGLLIGHSLISYLPEYDYLYLGDTARVPYGNRSQTTIYKFTTQALDFLFAHDCQLIIVACNSASAEALRHIQQNYLPHYYPDRRVLGVLIPAAEAAVASTHNRKIGVIGTHATIASHAFGREIQKLLPSAEVFQQSAPLLVPLVENNGIAWARPILAEYLKPLLDAHIDTLILGCTHYPYLKDIFREIVGPEIRIISQDEIIPPKLKDYLGRHPEIERQLSKSGQKSFYVTDLTDTAQQLAATLFGGPIDLQLISL